MALAPPNYQYLYESSKETASGKSPLNDDNIVEFAIDNHLRTITPPQEERRKEDDRFDTFLDDHLRRMQEDSEIYMQRDSDIMKQKQNVGALVPQPHIYPPPMPTPPVNEMTPGSKNPEPPNNSSS